MKKRFLGDEYNWEYFNKTKRPTIFSDRGKMMSIQRYHIFDPFVKEKTNDSQNVKMLEIGCANGFFLSLFKKRNIDLCGVDISDYCLNEAKKNLDANLFLADLDEEKLPFEDNSFDLVAAFTVLEHLHKPEGALKDIYRVSKEGAYIYIVCPVIPLLFFNQSFNYFVYNTIQRILGVFGKSLLTVHTHVSIFHKAEWFDMFKRTNYKIVRNFAAEGFVAPLFDGVSDIIREKVLTLFPCTALQFNVILQKGKKRTSNFVVPELEFETHYKRLHINAPNF